MIAITTKSSISVKPPRPRKRVAIEHPFPLDDPFIEDVSYSLGIFILTACRAVFNGEGSRLAKRGVSRPSHRP